MGETYRMTNRSATARPGAMSRRWFLVVGLATGAAGILAACAPAAPPASPSPAKPPPTTAPASPATPVAKPTTAAAPKPAGVPEKATTTAPAKAPPGPLQKVKYGLTSIQFDTAIQFIADRRGFWKEYGVDVEMTFIESDATLLTSLFANEFDVAYASVEGLAPAIAKGATAKIVGLPQPGLQYAFLAGPRVTRLEDLVGKSVAISRPGAVPDAVLRTLLKEVNIDVAKVEFVGIGGTSARVQAVAAGKVDATVAGIEAVYRALELSKDLSMLFATQERIPRYLRGTVAASGKTLLERPQIIAPVLAGEYRAIRFALENREEMLKIGGEITNAKPEDRPVLEKAYDFYIKWKLWNPDGEFDKAAIDYMQQIAVALGTFEKPLPVDAIATTKYNDEELQLVRRSR